MIKNIFKIIVLLVLSTNTFAYLPVKGSMKERVDFWIKVYTEITTNQAFAHDPKDLNLIYAKFNYPSGRYSKKRFIRNKRNEIRNLILSIGKKNYINLNKRERKLANLIGERSYKELKILANRIRFQSGLKDRYLKGLERSARFMPHIKKTFKKYGIPKEIIWLPHVESSFNYKAYSKVGAAGIWQFMRSTAKRYKLKVNYVVDERRDPIKSTIAAAKLLRDNYRILKSWPLALTAYNHGAASLIRAKKKLGTSQIHEIVERYKGRRFGFASKNFYATFMATVEISQNPYRYFDKIKYEKELKYSELKLKRPLSIEQITKETSLTTKEIKAYNYDIRKSAYNSPLLLPKNHIIKIPKQNQDKIKRLQLALNNIKTHYKALEMDKLHIVNRGESLYAIGKLYGISISSLVLFNNLSSPSKIYPGMKIKIPGKKSKQLASKLKVSPKTKTAAIKKVPLKSNPIKDKRVVVQTRPKSSKNDENPIINLSLYDLDLVKISKNKYKLTIETEETLGHYADWAGIPTQAIRNLNSFRYGRPIHLGQKIYIKLSPKQKIQFEQARNEYHLALQEDYFDNYKVNGTQNYKVKKGDTLSRILSTRELPYWLVRQYQKNKRLDQNLKVGQIIILPEVD